MKLSGNWKLVCGKAFDEKTFKLVWKTAAELALDDEEGSPYKMLAVASFNFLDDGRFVTAAPIPEGTDLESEEAKKFLASERCIMIDGQPKIKLDDFAWKEENGEILVNNGQKGEVLGEAINPWVPVKYEGNTIVVVDMYQLCREGEEPSVVLATPAAEAAAPKEASAETAAAAGTYIGKYTKFVGDPDDAKNTEDPFKLVLEADGTGMSYRDELDIKVPEWSVEGGEVKLTEKFLATIEYTGCLNGNELHLFNGDPKDDLTCEYVFEKE